MKKLLLVLALFTQLAFTQSQTPFEDLVSEWNQRAALIQSLQIQTISLNKQLADLQAKDTADVATINDLQSKLANTQASLDSATAQVAQLRMQIAALTTTTIDGIQTTIAKTCGTCGNTGGSSNTADAVYNQTLNISDAPQPNSGHVALFDIRGNVPYANAYWYWPHTPPIGDKIDFTYSFDLFITSADKAASQAVEWEMQVDDNLLVYNYAYQLNWKGNNLRTFDKATRSWLPTKYDLALFTADKWHHVVMHNVFDATNKQLTIDTLNVDGTVLNINIVKPAPPSTQTGRHFTNAFQLDSNGKTPPTPYKSYVDNMKVSYYAITN